MFSNVAQQLKLNPYTCISVFNSFFSFSVFLNPFLSLSCHCFFLSLPLSLSLSVSLSVFFYDFLSSFLTQFLYDRFSRTGSTAGWYGAPAQTGGGAPSTASWTAAGSAPCPVAPASGGGAASAAATARRPYRAKIRLGKPN